MAAALYGEGDRTLRILEQELGVAARARGNEVRLVGGADEVGLARKVLEELYGILREGNPVHPRDVRQAVRMVTEQPDVDLQNVYEDVLAAVGSRRRITAKNLAQREDTVGLAMKALADFRYDNLAIEIDVGENASGAVLVRLEGANPEVLEGYPFAFNINLETDFGRLAELLMGGARSAEAFIGTTLGGATR
jgi:hypothetical protein